MGFVAQLRATVTSLLLSIILISDILEYMMNQAKLTVLLCPNHPKIIMVDYFFILLFSTLLLVIFPIIQYIVS